MSEHDFQTEVLERMSRLEAQSKQVLDTVKKLEEQFQATKELTIIGGIISLGRKNWLALWVLVGTTTADWKKITN